MEIDQAISGMGRAGGAAEELAERLLSLSRASSGSATAATSSANELSKLSARADSVRAGFQGLVGTGQGLVNSFTGVSSSVYGADKAFTSVIPTLDAMAATVTGLLTALGQMSSGVSIAGFSIGRAGEGAAKLTAMGFDVLVKALKFQIEGAQKVTDNFHKLTMIGATFGGSIAEMVKAAAGTKTPIDEFAKAVAANAESIGKLGIGMNNGAKLVVGMSKNIYDTNDALVGLYGNLTELSKGTADYLSLQTQLGVDVVADYHNQLKYAQEYLLRQKELSSITGKTAETMKREEEGRRKQLDYNLKLGRLGTVAQENVREGMALSGKIFGDAGAKYAEEYFATGGKVYSAEALRYQAVNQEAADAIGNMMSTVNTDTDTYRKSNGKYLKDNAASLENYARSQEDMAEINRNAQNPIIKSQTETASAILENLKLIKDSTDIFAKLAEDRKKLEQGQTPDKLTQTFVDAERERSKIQRQIDEIVVGNMSNLGTAMGTLNAITLAMVQTMGDTTKTLNAFIDGINGVGNFSEKMANDLANKLTEAIRKNEAGRQQTPVNTIPGIPQRADGGVTSGPTVVGEAGAEAVIPLTNGSIPLRIDVSQLVAAMSDQAELTKDVLRELRDGNDLTKKLIDYTT
jgi:hypothetical protein